MGPRKSVWGVWRGCSRKREDWVGQAGWWVQPREICLAKARCLLAVEGLELCMDRGVGKFPTPLFGLVSQGLIRKSFLPHHLQH